MGRAIGRRAIDGREIDGREIDRMSTGHAEARRVLLLQAALSVAAAAFFADSGIGAVMAALYGGGIAVASAWLLARRLAMASDAAGDATAGMRVLYVGAVQRFALVLGLFALGMGALGLSPLPLIVGFAAAQLGFLLVELLPRGPLAGKSSLSGKSSGSEV